MNKASAILSRFQRQKEALGPQMILQPIPCLRFTKR
jgi:hypothetical protein